MSKELDYIADLERENRLLGERCNQLLKDKGDLTEKCKSFEEGNNKLLDVINNQDVKIADLESENVELKGIKDVATLIRANNDTVVTLMQLNNKLVSKNQQLTKAKEIIALGLRVCETSSIEYMNLYQKQAEQFLKEIEK